MHWVQRCGSATPSDTLLSGEPGGHCVLLFVYKVGG